MQYPPSSGNPFLFCVWIFYRVTAPWKPRSWRWREQGVERGRHPGTHDGVALCFRAIKILSGLAFDRRGTSSSELRRDSLARYCCHKHVLFTLKRDIHRKSFLKLFLIDLWSLDSFHLWLSLYERIKQFSKLTICSISKINNFIFSFKFFFKFFEIILQVSLTKVKRIIIYLSLTNYLFDQFVSICYFIVMLLLSSILKKKRNQTQLTRSEVLD